MHTPYIQIGVILNMNFPKTERVYSSDIGQTKPPPSNIKISLVSSALYRLSYTVPFLGSAIQYHSW